MPHKILIVEDEHELLDFMKMRLEANGYEVIGAADGKEGFEKARQDKPDLILLDLMLPKMSGYELCRRVRAEGVTTPILMLTARGEEGDRVLGLDLGADDYVTKPFSLRELLARVRALLRRAQPPRTLLDELRVNNVAIDFRKYQATAGGQLLDLTRREFQLLRVLASRPGEVVTRPELLDQVWGLDDYPTTRTVDNHIATLRAKIESNPDQPHWIKTVHGMGYRMENPKSEGRDPKAE